MNILVIGDKHLPFEHRNYLDFCVQTKKQYKCKLIVDIGDHVDFHAISNHNHDPDGYSPFQELKETVKKARKWYKAFPKAHLCMGNHDERIERAAVKYGLSRSYFKSYRELFELPRGWNYQLDYYMQGVRFFHGMGYGGQYAHGKAAVEGGCSTVMGHLHSNAGTMYNANEKQVTFGLATGCGIDRHSYAFNYGRDFRRKPILGCGVVLDNGRDGMFVPMEM